MKPTSLSLTAAALSTTAVTMRKAALVTQHFRLVVTDNEEIAPGIVLPRNATVALSGLMNHGMISGGVDVFRPERFLQPDGSIHPNPEELDFFPFGIGRHQCPGRHLAFAEVKAALIVLLRQYEVRTVSGNIPVYKYGTSDTVREERSCQETSYLSCVPRRPIQPERLPTARSHSFLPK